LQWKELISKDLAKEKAKPAKKAVKDEGEEKNSGKLAAFGICALVRKTAHGNQTEALHIGTCPVSHGFSSRKLQSNAQ
jgi:hypothetical protein